MDSSSDLDELRETVLGRAESMIERKQQQTVSEVDPGMLAQVLGTLGVTS